MYGIFWSSYVKYVLTPTRELGFFILPSYCDCICDSLWFTGTSKQFNSIRSYGFDNSLVYCNILFPIERLDRLRINQLNSLIFRSSCLFIYVCFPVEFGVLVQYLTLFCYGIPAWLNLSSVYLSLLRANISWDDVDSWLWLSPF